MYNYTPEVKLTRAGRREGLHFYDSEDVYTAFVNGGDVHPVSKPNTVVGLSDFEIPFYDDDHEYKFMTRFTVCGYDLRFVRHEYAQVINLVVPNTVRGILSGLWVGFRYKLSYRFWNLVFRRGLLSKDYENTSDPRFRDLKWVGWLFGN